MVYMTVICDNLCKTFADLKHDANLCGTLYGILCGSLSFMCPEYFLSKSRLTDD